MKSSIAFITDEPNATYHANPAWSSTEIKTLLKHGPAYVRAQRRGEIQRRETASMRFGSAFHAWMDGSFEDEYVVSESDDGRTAAYKADKQKAKAQRKTLLKPSQLHLIRRMHDALMSSDEVTQWLNDDDINECVIRKNMGLFNIQCRFDRLHRTFEHAIDWKTIDNIDNIPTAFTKYGYHISWGWYRRIARDLVGLDMPMHFAFVESNPPYRTRMAYVSDKWIPEVDHAIQRALQMLQHIHETKDWSDPTPSITLEPPRWLQGGNLGDSDW